MEHCCPQPSGGQPPPPPGGASADCELPQACDNTGCADEYMLFFDSCLPTLSNLPTGRFSVLEAFNTGCEVRVHPSCSDNVSFGLEREQGRLEGVGGWGR